MEKVMVVGEVKKAEIEKGAEVKKEKRGAGRDGDHWGGTDRCAKEVRGEDENKILKFVKYA